MLQEMVQHLLVRAEPTTNVSFVTMEQAQAMMREYQQAIDAGYANEDMDFVPLSTYAHKLMPPGRRPIRPLLSNELGVLQMASNPGSPIAGRIVCIRDRDLGMGTAFDARPGSHVTVPEALETPAPEEASTTSPVDLLLPGPKR